MKILVTGGAGFIGSNFVKYMLEHKFEEISLIRVLDNFSYSGLISNLIKIQSDKFELIRGDINDSSVVISALRDINVIFHFAAESHVDRSIKNSKVFFQANVMGTQNLLEAARVSNIDTFIHISTDEVYGSISKGSWTEESILAPNSPYAASKAAADLLALSFARTYGMDVRITRSSNNYGPNQFPEKIIPFFATNLIQGRKVPVYADGKNTRDWLHVEDNCRGIYLVYQKGQPREIYNLGGGKELSNLELTHLILKHFGLGDNMIEHVPDRPGHDFRYSLDCSKARETLGYKTSYNFEEGLESTLNWYRLNIDWWKPLRDMPN